MVYRDKRRGSEAFNDAGELIIQDGEEVIGGALWGTQILPWLEGNKLRKIFVNREFSISGIEAYLIEKIGG